MSHYPAPPVPPAPVPHLQPSTDSSAVPADAAAWRCPNEVLRRVLPATSLHSLLGFLSSAPRNYKRFMLLREGDSAEYRALLETTVVCELQRVAQEYAAV